MEQIEVAIDDEKFDDAENLLKKLKVLLGENNSEYKKMVGMLEDARLIWES